MNTTPIDHKIEFMAWNEETQKMTDWEYISKVKNLNKLITLHHVHLMQLTALRSIKNEPIYHHMIVKNEFGSNYIVDMFNYELMHVLTWGKLEIVGNRFQHSELLELCK